MRNAQRHFPILALAGGLALGALCWLADQTPVNGGLFLETIGWLGNSASLWLLLAFLWGVAARRRTQAAFLGALALGAAVLCYYGITRWTNTRPDIPPAQLVSSAAFWLGVALVGGALFGVLGSLSRSPRPWLRLGSVALLTALILGETLLYLLQIISYGDTTRTFMLLIELGFVLLIPWLILREPRSAIWTTLAALAVALLVAVLLRVFPIQL